MAEVDFNIDCWYAAGCGLKTERCQKICPRYLEMNYMIVNCGMPDATPYIKDLTPRTDLEMQSYQRLQEIKDHIVDYVEAGHDIFIVSKHSFTGKTSWAIKLMYRFFDRIWSGNGFKVRGYYLYVPDFVEKLKSFKYRDSSEYVEIIRILEDADIVIFDNITEIPLNENAQGVINSVIGKRLNANKSNIYTGYTDDDVSNLGKNIKRKLEDVEIIKFDGPNRKNNINRDDKRIKGE